MQSPSKAPKFAAFTLIELLIVVAIIAVLAAIAVPNFLEARTRCFVARAKADMRTMDTALGAYQVDNNRFPPMTDPVGQPFLLRLIALTTPVAYISTLPADPFDRKIGTFDGAINPIYPRNLYGYNIATDVGHGSDAPPLEWSLTSGGPDGQIQYPYFAFLDLFLTDDRYASFIYDPTNGTVSAGDMFRRGGNKIVPLKTGL